MDVKRKLDPSHKEINLCQKGRLSPVEGSGVVAHASEALTDPDQGGPEGFEAAEFQGKEVMMVTVNLERFGKCCSPV